MNNLSQIQHFFVVMLENRSFDHMLGMSGITGSDAVSNQPTRIQGLTGNESNNDAQGASYPASASAPFGMPFDPPHEFENVRTQLCGAGGSYASYPNLTNGGFVDSYNQVANGQSPGTIMKYFTKDQLPVLNALASEFVVCDHWFSPLPGPTWPNRFFLHAATCGENINSPTNAQVIASTAFDGYKFANGTIYQRLDQKAVPWQYYYGDDFPQIRALSGIPVFSGKSFFEDFASDLAQPNLPTYIFIEPSYGNDILGTDYKCGTSQHPLDDVTRGEAFLKMIYETIRKSSYWANSALIITYDEHGGFYDHVTPPPAIAPGDAPPFPAPDFNFQLYGVRVPAVIVSPWTQRNLIDHTLYDHTSILATIEDRFQLTALTERDKNANPLSNLFSLPAARTDAPMTLPGVAASGITGCDPVFGAAAVAPQAVAQMETAYAASPSANLPVDSSLTGFSLIALKQDLAVAQSEPEKEAAVARFKSVRTRLDAKRYMRDVKTRVRAARAMRKGG